MFALIFVSLVVLESPGLGLGHFFYLPIALIAIVGGPRHGLLAGLAATALYTIAIVANDNLPTRDLLTVSAPVRLVTYVMCGVLVGWFAQRNGELIGRLELLASRDRLTGLPNARAFEAAVDRRFSASKPFAILLGDLDGLRQQNEEGGHGEGDLVLVRLAETLGKLLRAEEEVARVGGDEFAILATVPTKDAAAARANLIEKRLAESGLRVTFGWAAFPEEGNNALGMIRVADERLYARKLVRGRRLGAPQQPSFAELSASTGGSSSARRRCTTARESTPASRPSGSTTGARSRSRSSSPRNASSSSVSGSSVNIGSSASSPRSVSRGSLPRATTSRTSVLRVTMPISRPSWQTSTARTSGRSNSSPACCALADASSTGGSAIIASRTLLMGRCRAPRVPARPRECQR
jgi:diguanylate cyclase (GGDEF)-like protein